MSKVGSTVISAPTPPVVQPPVIAPPLPTVVAPVQPPMVAPKNQIEVVSVLQEVFRWPTQLELVMIGLPVLFLISLVFFLIWRRKSEES